jgi:predicted dehydrogenase
VQLRNAIRAGRLGAPVTISAEQTALHGLSLTQDAWRAQAHESPVGAMTAIGVHLVDGMIDLMGNVAWVYASVARRAAPYSDDTTDVLLRFVNGASGHIICSTAATPNYRMAVYGTGGFAEILGHPMATFRLVPSGGGERLGSAAPEVLETPGFNMLTAELEEFAAAVAEKRAFATPLDQILHGVQVFEAIAASAAGGKAVTLPVETAAG